MLNLLETCVFLLLAVTVSACGSPAGRSDDGDEAEGEQEIDISGEDMEEEDAASRDAVEEDAVEEDAAEEDAGAPEPREIEPACDPERRERSDKGEIALGDELEDVLVEECTEHVYTFVAPAGMKVRIALASDRTYPVIASLVWPDDPNWDERIERIYSGWSPAEAVIDIPRSGEFVILVRGIDALTSPRYDISVTCSDACGLETTRFPVVMVHGWTGFSEIGPLEYFYGVNDDLAPRGYLLYIAELDPYNSVEVRSGQLAEQIDAFLEEGRARKVNVVAHSQGGLDTRRVISTLGYGDRIASLVTIATPHYGTPIADVATGALPGPAEEALFFLLNLLGAAATGHEQEARDSFESLAEDYVRNTFNPENPDDPAVTYISWTGLTCLFGITCDDVCDIEIRWAYDLIYLMRGDNDGMVPVESGQWGEYMGTIPADHFDEVGQLFGVTGPNFDHLEFYHGVVSEIRGRGL